jgi:Tol biopolymer transport system component
MKARLTIAAALAATLVCAALVAGAARATYRGATNGRLAFAITVEGNTDVYSVLPNGNAFRRLTDEPGFDACPAYAADGNSITWCSYTSPTGASAGGISAMKANGTKKRRLSDFGNFPDISPDGSRIAFSGAPSGSTNVDIWVIDIDGGGLTRLTTAEGQDQFPAWSPDGTKLVFASTRTGVKQVWLMNADGSDQEQLTLDATPKDQVPDWSPEGTQIAYVARTAPAGGDIWIVNADGSNPHPITSGADKLGAAWSPDGTQIATLDWPTRTIEIMNADGGDVHPVHPGGIQFVPGWQPRGTDEDDDQ